MDDQTEEISQRLSKLRDSIRQDSDALATQDGRFADGSVIFNRLFDVIGSTLQNMNGASAKNRD